MAETIGLETTLVAGKSRNSRRQHTFKSDLSEGRTGTVRWTASEGLSSGTLYFNGQLLARGLTFLSGGEAAVSLHAKNKVLAYLTGPQGASLNVKLFFSRPAFEAQVSNPVVYQGGFTEVDLSLPDFTISPDAQLFAIPGYGLRGESEEPGAPVALQVVNEHQLRLRLIVSGDAPLGPVGLEIKQQEETIATATLRIRYPFPVGNGLLKVRTLLGAGAGALNSPGAIAEDLSGAVWIADTGNHSVKRMTTGATPQTVAGGGAAGNVDGPALTARFNTPSGIAVSPGGEHLYIADTGNNSIRLLAEGVVVTVAGSVGAGYADGPVASASFRAPRGLALASDGSLYVADMGNHVIRRIDPDGVVNTVAGNGKAGDADGPALEAQLNGPSGVAVAPDGTVYFTDSHRVRALTTDGLVRTLGGGRDPGFMNFIGAGARFNRPGGIAFADGKLLVADAGNGMVREVRPDGLVLTVAGGGRAEADDTGDSVRLGMPADVLVGADGALKFCDSATNEVRSAGATDEPLLQLLVPPLPNAVTGDERVNVRGRTNRPGAKIRAAVTPDNILNQQLEAEADADGFFELLVQLTPAQVNQVQLSLMAPDGGAADGGAPPAAAAAAADGVELTRSLSIRSQPGLDDVVVIEPKDCEQLETAKIRIKLILKALAYAAAAVAVVVGIASAVLQFITTVFPQIILVYEIAKEAAKILLQEGAVTVIRILIDVLVKVPQGRLPEGNSPQKRLASGETSGAAGDDDDDQMEVLLASKACILIDTGAGGADIGFEGMTDGQVVADNRIDVPLRVDQNIATAEVNGIPVGPDGVARGVPLTDETTQLVARVTDRDGQVTLQSISVKLAEGIPPKRLLPDKLPPAFAAPGETVTLSGPRLDQVAESVEVETAAGSVVIPVRPAGPDRVEASLPPDATNGTMTLFGADDTESLTLSLRGPEAIPGEAGALLSESAPRMGRPMGDEAYAEREQPLRVDWLPQATVGEVNALMGQFRLRLVGARVRRMTAEGGEAARASARLWFGVAEGDFLAALDALQSHPSVAVAECEYAEGGEPAPATVGFATRTSRFKLDWKWDLAATPQALATSSTWQLQLPRFPAIWNLKAYATQRTDAVITDKFSALNKSHEDVPFEFRITRQKKKDTHGYTVGSVYGAKHNGPKERQGTDGANPLHDPNHDGGLGCVLYATSYIDFTDLSDLLHDGGSKIRVVNFSLGLSLTEKGCSTSTPTTRAREISPSTS